ncbi:hypothetical protein B0H34DRAFT_757239 [Crassisporium funariophilum]|nr:hypothetical protein B0H34DRAFT_757239 [Crassisporium funariophilum]
MHLISLNIPELLLALWRGTLECDVDDDKSSWDWAVLVGETWKIHGQRVADATPYLPGSFDRPPRNPAKKISSGYKAWEYLTYIFGLGPGLFHGLLPDKYWKNYCKLVAGVRLLHQRSIPQKQLLEGHRLLVSFVQEFEDLYYQRKPSRLHFCRQSIHALLHVGPEVIRLGPGGYYSQWTMERTIGNLGEEIRQPSNPFKNLAARGVRRARINALLTMMPELQEMPKFPKNFQDLGNGYNLIGPVDNYARHMSPSEETAIRTYYESQNAAIGEGGLTVTKWAVIRLPNQQLVRTLWKEKRRALEKLRTSRNIMARLGGQIKTLAMISVFGPPDAQLLQESSGSLIVCNYQGFEELKVIAVQQILSCVAMVPFGSPPDGRYFVCEKMGLEMAFLGRYNNEDLED